MKYRMTGAEAKASDTHVSPWKAFEALARARQEDLAADVRYWLDIPVGDQPETIADLVEYLDRD